MGLPGEVRIVPDVPSAFADLVVERQPTAIGLSGAWLARDCYSALRAVDLDWSSIEVFFGDERFVPVESDDSNEGQARRVLLDHVEPRAVHGMYADCSVAEAATRYDALIRRSPPLDLLHLGVGPDGHTASLFPHTKALDETARLVVANADERHPHARVTFTFPAIERARLVVVTVSGAEKRDAILRLRAGEDLPAARIRAAEVIWLLDPEAAGESLTFRQSG